MENTYTTTTKRSYGNKITSTLKGVFFGILLIIGSVVLTFVNESRQADQMRMLGDVSKKVVEVEPMPDLFLEGQLVHMTGVVTTPDTLSDPDFGFTPPRILKLRRQVEMYQWHEDVDEDRRDTAGGGEEITRTVSYEKRWSSSPIDSGSFEKPGYNNPGIFPLQSTTQSARHMNLENKIMLSTAIMNAIGGFQEYRPEQRLPGYTPAAGTPYYYNGKNYADPAIGDVRIAFSVIPEGVFSLLGTYSKNSLQPYIKKDQSLALASPGIVGAQEMIQAEKKRVSVIGWVLRGVGLIMMWIGLGALFAPLRALASIVPFFGRVVGSITGIVTFLVSLATWAVVVSVAWILARPVVGTIFAVITIGIFVAARKLAKRKKMKTEQTTVVPPVTSL